MCNEDVAENQSVQLIGTQRTGTLRSDVSSSFGVVFVLSGPQIASPQPAQHLVLACVNSGSCWDGADNSLKQVQPHLLNPYRRLVPSPLWLTLHNPHHSRKADTHSKEMEPQEAALFLPLNQDDLMASLKDHSSWLPNCYPSSTFALITVTLCHTSLQGLNKSFIRNSVSLLCYKASLTWVKSSHERHHRATEFYLFPFLQWLLFHSCHSVEWTSYLFRTWKFRYTMQKTLQSLQPFFLLGAQRDAWRHSTIFSSTKSGECPMSL